MYKIIVAIALLCVIGLTACSDVRIKENPEWQKYFDEAGVEGSFEIYENNKEIARFYNKERGKTRYSPASTFKIFNALVALEMGIAPDEQMVIKWDGVARSNADWNKDMNMAEAFKVSAVPYFQELARRIGKKDMHHYLDTTQYGNKNMGNTIDSFWLDGSLLISADEQVGLMKRLYHAELPFSERTQRIVKGMMLQKEAENYKLYYKTGWSTIEGKDHLWVVGFVEKSIPLKHVKTGKLELIPHPSFFALEFVPKDKSDKDWKAVRIALLQQLLAANDLGFQQ